jgi:hypothetical protein
VAFGPAVFDRYVLAFIVSGFFQALAEPMSQLGKIAGRCAVNKTNHRRPRLLRARRKRPEDHRAAEKRDELPPAHSITSSASSSMD